MLSGILVNLYIAELLKLTRHYASVELDKMLPHASSYRGGFEGSPEADAEQGLERALSLALMMIIGSLRRARARAAFSSAELPLRAYNAYFLLTLYFSAEIISTPGLVPLPCRMRRPQ